MNIRAAEQRTVEVPKPKPPRQPVRLDGRAAGPTGATGGSRNVTVLMGGPSAEREVSLASGRAIAAGLRRLGHRVIEADIGPRDTAALDAPGIDVVFIALHGAFGESGEVQELCEQRGLAYTGSGPRASRLAMDKVASKEVFRAQGVLTPDWAVVESSHAATRRRELLAHVGLPAVVKPIDGGSSLDVVIARDAARRDIALEELLAKYGRILVERFVAGRELTVGILGEQALPVLEIVPAREFYDYTAKYADGSGTQYRFDLGLAEATVRAAEAASLASYRALGCRDMLRVDFILDDAGQAWMLEVNTIPGFTGHSLLPMAAARAGVSFDRLVGRLVELAHARSPAAAGDSTGRAAPARGPQRGGHV